MIAVVPALAQDDVSSSGTGFFVNRDGWIVTNAHVVDGCSKLSVPDIGDVTDWKIDKQNDLAAFRIAGGIGKQPVPFSTSAVRLGEDIAAFGYPLNGYLSDAIKVTTGNINSLVGAENDTRFLQISTPLQPGNSGGPVVNSSGALVGLATAVLGIKFTEATGIAAQNVNFAVRSNVLEMFLQSRGIALEPAALTAERLSTADLSEKIVPSVVPIFCHGAKTAPVEPSAAFAPASVAAPAFRSLENYDVIGFDYATLKDVSRYQCETACGNDTSCRATTYNKKERFCFLKNDAKIIVQNNDASASISEMLTSDVSVSTFAMAAGKDMAGGDYKRLNGSTFISCYLACEVDNKCRAFAYVRKQNICWMKDRITSVTTKSGVDLVT